MTVEFIARSLHGRRAGSSWMAQCPAHDDRSPSLALREKNGHVLVHCHSGCEQRDVVEALRGLGLWETEDSERQIVAEYNYTDERGQPLYQIVRFLPKDFRQRYRDGVGGWIWKKHPRQVLYRLHEVLRNRIIFVVEGEKDANNLRDRGFIATTNAGGAKAPWLPQFTEALAGREIIVIPDNDEPGYARANAIAAALLQKARRLIILELDDVKDISDWFAAGHSETELIAVIEETVE